MKDFFPHSVFIDAFEAQSIDQEAIHHYKIPSLSLMENAGRGVAEALLRENISFQQKGLILCGPGLNGGDGFVTSRYLQEWKIPHDTLYIGNPEKIHGDAQVNFLRLSSSPQVIQSPREWKSFCSSNTFSFPWIIDALFGTGLNKEVQGLFKLVIKDLEFSKRIFSIDVPSGLCASSGKKMGTSVCAYKTYALHLPKTGLAFGPDSHRAGILEVIPIGIPVEIEKKIKRKEYLISPLCFREYLKPRLRNSHKGIYGHALTFASSREKIGAGLLTARAALRIGAGLSSLALPENAYQKLDPHFAEIMFEPFEPDWSYFFGIKSKKIAPYLKGKKALACGPGMGISEGGRDLIHYLMNKTSLPLFLDADALNIMSAFPSFFNSKQRKNLLLTPHPGEMEKLLKSFKFRKELKREKQAKIFCTQKKLYLILKGYRSLLATPTGEVWVNPNGGPSLATAGSGDVLTGILLGLSAQGLPFFFAAMAGLWIHGRAGDLLSQKKGERGVLAGDIVEILPQVLKELE